MTSALIFTRTKHGANRLLITLKDWGKKVAVIHSNRSQSQRQQALEGFKNRQYQILIATDIAARGIDVKDISHVINFDVPRHAEDYVHRIGRTGRAQAIGEAFTLVAPDEEEFLQKIERFIKKTIPRGVLADFPYQSKPKLLVQPAVVHHAPSHQGQRSHQHQRPQQPHRGQGSHQTQPQGQFQNRSQGQQGQPPSSKRRFRWRRPHQ